jgi:hypothetical protein
MRIAFALALVACRADAPSPIPDPADLVHELEGIRAAEDREARIARMVLPSDGWGRIVVEPYRALYAEYSAAFEPAALAGQLAHPGPITARRHYAGDPRLTSSQGRLRWALPVQYPSLVAEIDGHPIDTVFVYDGSGWRVLESLDGILLAHARKLDGPCADRLALAGPAGHCTEVGWAIAEAALRDDRAAFTRACQLAATLCGIRSP